MHYFVPYFITSSPNGAFVINAGTHGPGVYNYRGSSSRTVALSVADPTFAGLVGEFLAHASTCTWKRPQATKHSGVSSSRTSPDSRRPIGMSDSAPSCKT